MNNRPKTYDDIMVQLIDSIEVLFEDINNKQKSLKKSKDNEESTKLHYATRIIQAWFRSNGGLPIPD